MEIGPLQRMAPEPDVDVIKGYHSYAVRTSPVCPDEDYEEEPLPEPEPPSPEPRGDLQRRGGTSTPPQEREEKPQEPRQRPSPERRAAGRAEPRAPARTEPRAGAKRSSAAVREAEECEVGPNTIVICMVILLNIGLAILFVHFLT